MDFFLTLYLAHVIGDFPLQTDAIFRLKQKSTWGVTVHVLVCTLVNIVLLAQMLEHLFIWLTILFIAVIHITLDRTKMFLAVFRDKDGLGYFFLDQGLHLLSLMLAAWYVLQVLPPSAIAIWLPRPWIISLTALFIAAFAIPPVTFYVQRSLFTKRDAIRNMPFPSCKQRLPGALIRFCATLGLILGGWYVLLYLSNLLSYIFPTPVPSKLLKYRIAETGVNLAITLFCGVFAWHLLQLP